MKTLNSNFFFANSGCLTFYRLAVGLFYRIRYDAVH